MSQRARYASVIDDPVGAAEQLFARLRQRPRGGHLRLVCHYENSDAIFELSYLREGETTTFLVSWTHQNNGRRLPASVVDGRWHVPHEQWLRYDAAKWELSRPSLLEPPGYKRTLLSNSLRVVDFVAFSHSWLLFETHFLNLFRGILPRGRRFGFTGLLAGRQGARRLNSVAFAYLLLYDSNDSDDDDQLTVETNPIPTTFSRYGMRLFELIIRSQGRSASTGAVRTGITPCWRWAAAETSFEGRWRRQQQPAAVTSTAPLHRPAFY